MHGAYNYPLKKEKSDKDVPLPDGTQDEEYLATLAKELPSIVDQLNPDMVFYLSGVDILASDKLGRLACTKDGCKKRDEFVFELFRTKNIPVVVAMGGGYSEQISDIIDAHANTFRVANHLYG